MEQKNIREMKTAELLNIVAGDATGRTGEAVAYSVCDSVAFLSTLKEEELQQLEGVGRKGAQRIVAAMELARRCTFEKKNQRRITSAQDVRDLLFTEARLEAVEHLWCIFLRNNNTIIKWQEMTKGGISGVAVDIRLILREALLCRATGLVMVHNHPSGTNRPSQEDRNLTEKVKNAAKVMEVRLVDHIILTGDERCYYSFNEMGEL